MKKIVFVFWFSILNYTYAQKVGINTDKPQTLFHVDGGKDNSKSGAPTQNQLYNDVLIDTNANVGIGRIPDSGARINIVTDTSQTTEIGKGFRLKDGTEGKGNLLSIINSSGDVAWKPRVSTVQGTLANSIFPVNSDLTSTGAKIVLPPGKWLIRSSILLRVQDKISGGAVDGSFTDGVYCKLSWADQNSDGTFSPTADAVSGNIFGGAYYSRYGLAFGQTVVNNNSGVTKTYYLITRTPVYWGTQIITQNWRNLGGAWGENVIIAFAAN